MGAFPASLVIFAGIANELSDIPTLGAGPGGHYTGLVDGQPGYVAQTGVWFVLTTSSDPVSSTVLATRDDPSRRWVATSGGGGGGFPTVGVDKLLVGDGTTTALQPANLGYNDTEGLIVDVAGNPLHTKAWATKNLTNTALTVEGFDSYQRNDVEFGYRGVRQTGTAAAPTVATIQDRFADATPNAALKLYRVGDDSNADGSNPLVVDATNLDTYIGSDLRLAAAAVKGFAWVPTIDGPPVGVPAKTAAPGTAQVPMAYDPTARELYVNQLPLTVPLPGAMIPGTNVQSLIISGINGETMGGIQVSGTITTGPTSGNGGLDVLWTFLPQGSQSNCQTYNGANTGATATNKGLSFYAQPTATTRTFSFLFTMASTATARGIRGFTAMQWDDNGNLQITNGWWLDVSTPLTSLAFTAIYRDGVSTIFTNIVTGNIVWSAMGRP